MTRERFLRNGKTGRMWAEGAQLLKHTKYVTRNPGGASNTQVGLWRVIHDERRRGALNAATAVAAVAAVGAVAFELPLPLPSHNKGDDDIQRLAAVSLTDAEEGQCNRFWQEICPKRSS